MISHPKAAAGVRDFIDEIPLRRGLGVFERAGQGFLDWLEEIGEGDNELSSGYWIRLRWKVSSGSSVNAAWADVFLSLWCYCDNFFAARWRPLLAIDRSAVGYAAEACYYVLAVSGADGSSQLIELIDSFDAADEVRSFMAREHRDDTDFNAWVERLLRKSRDDGGR